MATKMACEHEHQHHSSNGEKKHTEINYRRPEPTVTWLNGDEIMQTGGGISMGRHVTVNRLEIPKMTRAALNNTYKCQASNTKLVPPAERSIRVDMLLKPLSTALSSKPKQLISSQEYVVACNVEGSVPETDIKWMQNNRPFTKGKIKIINNSSMVSSVLSFRPHPDDDGTILKCEGSNPRLQNSVLEDSVIMNVLYPPQVTLSLGSTLNPDDIKEGDDVYFECHIKANPREHRITWSHDGLAVTQNVTSGVIISTRSLVLQRVGRFHSGSYACAAANDRGETQSDPVALKIHFAPVCISSSIMIVGASLDETVPVPCHVAADPLDVSFDWNFSNSGERFEVASGQFNLLQEFHSEGITQSRYDADEDNSETIYELLYTPKSEREYGTLACWAKNSIGKQVEPCLFQVVPAAKPAPLRNCTLRPYSTLLPPPGQHGVGQNATSAASAYSYSYGEPPPVRGQHYRDTNYIGPQFVKDRNVPTDRRNVTAKFNQKNPNPPEDRPSGSLRSPAGSSVGRAASRRDRRNRTVGRGGGGGVGVDVGLPSIRDASIARLTADDDGEGGPPVGGPGTGSKEPPPLPPVPLPTHPTPEMLRRRAAAAAAAAAGKSTPSSEERNSRANLLNTATAVLLGEGGSAAVLASSATGHDPSGLQRGSRLRRYTASARNASLPPSNQDDDRAKRGGNNYHSSADAAAAAASAPPIASQLRSKTIRHQSTPAPPSGPSPASLASYGGYSGVNGATGHGTSYGGNHHQQQQQQHYYTADYGAGATAGGGGGLSASGAGPNELPTMMELECVAGYDGGLPQHFFLEAYDSRTRKLRLNITSALNDVPLFRIDLTGEYADTELSPSEAYTPTLHLIAYSVNQKGRSEPTILEDIAINEAEKRTVLLV
uniref:Ig-like domain-containing protein n=1 Tax=Anopheles dirus TaxID=7168 RepID=A0A182NL74_9DIPT